MGCSPWQVVKRSRRLSIPAAGDSGTAAHSWPEAPGAAPGAASWRPEGQREMPGGSGQGTGTPGTLKTGRSQVVFNSSALKALHRGQRKLAAPIRMSSL